MKARRYAPGMAMAIAAMLLAWGSLAPLSAQYTGDQDQTGKSSRRTSKTTHEEMSSTKSGNKIIDKLGGMTALDALTDRFVADLMGTTVGSLRGTEPGNWANIRGTAGTSAGNMAGIEGNASGRIGMQGGLSGIGQTGVSGSGMGTDTLGNTGMAPHATGEIPGHATTGTTGTVGNTGTGTGTMGNSGSAGVTGTTGSSGVSGSTTDKYGTTTSTGTMGQTGYSGSGMGSMSMSTRGTSGGWSYTAVREDIRTRLCKAAGGNCKVRKLSKTERENQPSLSEAEWSAAINDFRSALSSYNLSSQDQDKLVMAVNGAKKDFVRGARDMDNDMEKMHGKGSMHQRHHSGSGSSQGGSMEDEKNNSGGKVR